MSDDEQKAQSPHKGHKKDLWHSSPRTLYLKAVENFINAHNVAVFSKTWCPWCDKVKELLNQRNVSFAVLELDLEEHGASYQQALNHLSDRKTVPNVYINKTCVGGYSDLAAIVEAGLLDALLKGRSIEFEFDLIVIGGGSGGLSAAKEAASLGKKVAVCDYVVPSPLGSRWGLGGTCVNVGCIPKKLMHRASIIRQDLTDAEDFGWKVGPVRHDWDEMVHRIQTYIKSLNFGQRKSLMELKITYFNYLASFVDKHTVQLVKENDKIQATAKNFVIATGGRPKYLDIPGAQELCITSDDLFGMRNPPGRTLIIGASYIALECAGFLVGLGYDVFVMVRSILLRNFDRQMVSKVEASMTAYGVKFIKNCVPKSFQKNEKNGTVEASWENQEGAQFSGAFDTVLIAAGRSPCTKNLNLEGIGVDVHPSTSKIITDAKERTSVSNIFAIGDVCEGKLELTPVAIQAGKLLAQRLYNAKTTLMDYTNVPTTLFTPVEYSFVGATEEEALNTFEPSKIEIYHQEFQCLESVLNTNPKYQPKGFAKLVVVKEGVDEIVIGAHILAPNAGEIIQGFAIGVKMKATKRQFDDLVAIHPTTAEVFTTLSITKSSGKPVEATGC